LSLSFGIVSQRGREPWCSNPRSMNNVLKHLRKVAAAEKCRAPFGSSPERKLVPQLVLLDVPEAVRVARHNSSFMPTVMTFELSSRSEMGGLASFSTCGSGFFGGKLMGKSLLVCGPATFAPRLACLLRSELMRCPFAMSGDSSLAGHLAFFVLIHRGKPAAFFLSHGSIPTPGPLPHKAHRKRKTYRTIIPPLFTRSKAAFALLSNALCQMI
jgi:hypothetical protein